MTYQIRTSQFEGPMDLLLFLIEKEELDITALALAKVTDEFLAYVETMRGRLEMEIVADFLVIAARLLWLKSLVLLPRPPQSVEAEGDDIEDELVQQLRAYRQYKESAQWFRERDEAGLRTYVHIPPTFHAQRVFLDLTGVTVEKLHAAAKTVFYPNEGLAPQDAIQRPRITIGQQIRLIRERLSKFKQMLFHSLFSPHPTRVEAVVTLQAVLELVKQQTISVTQRKPFGEILINPLILPEAMVGPEVSDSVPPATT